MRLLKLYVQEFRRFVEGQNLDVQEPLIALVGPNEAGKSSLLRALQLLGLQEGPAPSDVSRSSHQDPHLAGLFALEESDREAIGHIDNIGVIDRVKVTLRYRSEPSWAFEQHPLRNLMPRTRCLSLLENLKDDPALDSQYSADPEDPWEPERFEATRELLRTRAESLSESEIASLETLARQLTSIRFPEKPPNRLPGGKRAFDRAEKKIISRREARQKAREALIALCNLERQPTPSAQASKVLAKRLPKIVFFQPEDRQLRSEYDLEDLVETPSPALDHLCALANLDLSEVSGALDAGNHPRVEKLIENANSKLKETFQQTWTQSSVYPRLGTPADDKILRLHIATDGDTAYSRVEERSDGLRWFMALHAFLSATKVDNPILLVDEAETHLHYDAQADLIDALMRQQVAPKVIYTTHSIGCLPPDLGRGIRAVLPAKDSERSHVYNSYWSVGPSAQERVGYSPLLLAMGAKLLSLTVPRFAVITEGQSDALLLPSLIKATIKQTSIPYRIVSGLAELKDQDLSSLHHQAGKVLCLVDGDRSGSDLARRIIKSGIDMDCVFSLAEGCTLEDIVDAFALSHALNDEISTWSLGSARVESDLLPKTGRWAWFKQWAEENDVEIGSLSKIRVAQQIVDLTRSNEATDQRSRFVQASRVRGLRSLHDKFLKAFGF